VNNKKIHFGKLYKKTNPNSIFFEYVIPISYINEKKINIYAVDTGNEGYADLVIFINEFALDETE